MSERRQRLESALATVRLTWDEAEADAAAQRFVRTRRRRRRVRRSAAATTALALVGGAALLLLRPAPRSASAPAVAARPPELSWPPRVSPPASPRQDDGVLRFADGSTATPLDAHSTLRVVSADPARLVVAIDRGGARFAVTHDPRRLFRVLAGTVTVEVLGTRFTVERLDERARVSVDAGRVHVHGPGHASVLGAGERGLFPPPRAAVTRRESTWRELAHDGDYDAAYAALTRPAPALLRDEPAELLLAADVARLSHHPADAIAPLRALVARHSADPRAQLAAFTLGRVLLEELGQPTEAADAFASAAALAPARYLSQDALAREVEAWSRAGDLGRARARAEEYVRRYPAGARLRSVRRFGGLE